MIIDCINAIGETGFLTAMTVSMQQGETGFLTAMTVSLYQENRIFNINRPYLCIRSTVPLPTIDRISATNRPLLFNQWSGLFYASLFLQPTYGIKTYPSGSPR